MILKIINIKRDKELTKLPNFIYLGRGTIFGNPYSTTSGLSKELAIGLYRNYLIYSLKNGSIPLSALLDLEGKIIGCSCKPARCHLDVVLQLYNMAKEDIKNNQPIRFFDTYFKFNDDLEEAVDNYDE